MRKIEKEKSGGRGGGWRGRGRKGEGRRIKGLIEKIVSSLEIVLILVSRACNRISRNSASTRSKIKR